MSNTRSRTGFLKCGVEDLCARRAYDGVEEEVGAHDEEGLRVLGVGFGV